MSVNYDLVCRLCLSSRGELLPIFPTTSSDETETPVLVSKIKDCVAVQINQNDDLPTNVCKKCLDNVNNWHKFKTVCERTQNKLQSLVKKDGSQLEEVQVKTEPLSDEAYDDGVVIDGSYPDVEDAAHKLQPEGPPILASLGLTPRSDKNVDPRMDWHRVHAILNIVQDQDVIDSLQTIEECDILHHSDHDSESETELSDIPNNYIDYRNGFICKNNQVISRHPKELSLVTITKIKDALKLKQSKDIARRICPKPKDAWQFIFTDDLLELIVTSTNENILKRGKHMSDIVSVAELKTVMGILYFHGIMRPIYHNCTELWNNNVGIHCIKKAMKYSRFKFILENLCFDCEEDSILELDTMKRIRKVFEIFSFNCRTSFNIDSVAVIDEVIIPTYGPCSFRYEISKKPLKRGLKMVMLVDAANLYVSNLDIITDSYFQSDEIVTKLAQHLAGSGRTIILDSWYTSIELIKKLKLEYDLFTIAALNPKNDIIPPLFVSKNRKCKTFLTGFIDENITLTSYYNKKAGKSINIVTNDPKYYKRGFINHTTAVSVYKKNQSVVEVVEVLMHYYTTMQCSNDWTLSLFFTLLNIASINAQVMWTSNTNCQPAQRRIFIQDLAASLIETNDHGIKAITHNFTAVKQVLKTPIDPMHRYKNRGRCRVCATTTKKDRRSRMKCMKCGIYICGEHTISTCICVTCHAENNSEEMP